MATNNNGTSTASGVVFSSLSHAGKVSLQLIDVEKQEVTKLVLDSNSSFVSGPQHR